MLVRNADLLNWFPEYTSKGRKAESIEPGRGHIPNIPGTMKRVGRPIPPSSVSLLSFLWWLDGNEFFIEQQIVDNLQCSGNEER